MKKKLITEDDYTWKIEEPEVAINGAELLKYIGGVDISFSKDDPSVACGTLVVLNITTLDVVYEDSAIVSIDVPYVPGFLAFREVCYVIHILQYTVIFAVILNLRS